MDSILLVSNRHLYTIRMRMRMRSNSATTIQDLDPSHQTRKLIFYVIDFERVLHILPEQSIVNPIVTRPPQAKKRSRHDRIVEYDQAVVSAVLIVHVFNQAFDDSIARVQLSISCRSRITPDTVDSAHSHIARYCRTRFSRFE